MKKRIIIIDELIKDRNELARRIHRQRDRKRNKGTQEPKNKSRLQER